MRLPSKSTARINRHPWGLLLCRLIHHSEGQAPSVWIIQLLDDVVERGNHHSIPARSEMNGSLDLTEHEPSDEDILKDLLAVHIT